ncbi:cell morphogenesis C-terminal-domain-containing protein [Mucidula mucida]|nr:cell morphogenesis C-terminal-domain-containing protein [Mucidula mucida]
MLTGLRSSTTSVKTMSILQTLTQFNDGTLIDPSEGRVRDLYIVGLPWFLNAMNVDNKSGIDEDLGRFAERIGELAKRENRPSISKIMTSFAKGHFRTRDDFLRQSVSSLREHYAADYWTHMVTLFLGLVLNKERWLRVQSMQILKVLFQQTRNLAEPIGSELLMPLLRLLETDLSAEALDVLEEPLVMSGGLPAKHVLRMSMHARNLMKEDNSAAIVFGVPEESGWCVVQADSLRETCRANMMGVFDTCSMPSRPSRIDFQPEEVEEVLGFKPAAEEDLGGLVQNLHDLTTFFQDVPSKQPSSISIPNRRLEARVAAILAKSTASEGISDVPATPFVDVFRVGMQDSDDESDDSSCTDSDTDAFIFDSPSIYHSAPNGSRYR